MAGVYLLVPRPSLGITGPLLLKPHGTNPLRRTPLRTSTPPIELPNRKKIKNGIEMAHIGYRHQIRRHHRDICFLLVFFLMATLSLLLAGLRFLDHDTGILFLFWSGLTGFFIVLSTDSLHVVLLGRKVVRDPYLYPMLIMKALGRLEEISDTTTNGTGTAKEAEGLGVKVEQESGSSVPEGETQEEPRPAGTQESGESVKVFQGEMDP